jgi:DNA (cytosine-5)-methyltransferase 1
MGYHRAGFDEIVGVDIAPQPHYPFTFIQADALHPPVDLADFDLIHASPPCQAYSRMRHLPWLKDKDYPDLIPPTRALLSQVATSWVIENVEDAPLARRSSLFGDHGTLLCGQMFPQHQGLYRHRVFETSFPIARPDHPRHRQTIHGGRFLNKRYSQSGGVAGVIPIVTVAGHTTGMMRFAPQAMGIDWMTRDELTQSIPPAYTEYVGAQFLTGATTSRAEGVGWGRV